MRIPLRAIALLVGEGLVTAYVSLLAYLLCAWMVDDSAAARMTELEWYLVAAKRLGVSTLAAAALAWGVHQVNRRWVVAPFGGSRRHALRVALTVGACVVLAGLLGALRFVIDRPFM